MFSSECNFARTCWQEVGVDATLPDDQFVVTTWLRCMLANRKVEVLMIIVAVLCGIWFFYFRNKKVWEDKVVTTRVVVK